MTDSRTFMHLSTLQPLQYGMWSIKHSVTLAALHWVHSSLPVSILGHLSVSKTGYSTPTMFSQGLGRRELSLPQPVGYDHAANTTQYVLGFFPTRTSFCLMFDLCPPQPAPPPDLIPVLCCKAAH